MSKSWIAVASADHVRIGREVGVMQICHGKLSPLKRIKPGDFIAYYSPSEKFQGKDRYQSFTAIGTIEPKDPYQIEMEDGFCPFRRDVRWAQASETPIKELLPKLDFSRNRKNWGYQLRFGLFEISQHDMQIIANAMKTNLFLNEQNQVSVM